MPELTAIGFDADDTLWDHERYFQLTQARFAELLRDYAEPTHLNEHLLAAERRNVLHYGFGVKGFTLSMIETAIEVTNGTVPGHVLKHVLKAGRAMLRHPIEPMPGARETLEALAGSHTAHPHHQGRSVRPGAEARGIGARRFLLRGRDRLEQGRRRPTSGSSRATATARRGP